MTVELSVSEFAHQAIDAALSEFVELGHLNEQDFSGAKLPTGPLIVTGPLIAAAERSLVALAEFGAQNKWTARIDHHLRAAIKSAVGRNQVQSLIGLLGDETLFKPAVGGWQSVYDRFLTRREEYDQELRKLGRRHVVERFRKHLEKPLVDPRWENESAELRLPNVAYATLRNALKRVICASELEDPSLTLIHEFGDSLNDVQYKLDLYQEVFDRQDDWRLLKSRVDALRIPTESVDRYALLKARCTKWLEKERQMDASLVLRELTEVCRARYQQTFRELANLLGDSPGSSDLHTSCLDAVGRLVEST